MYHFPNCSYFFSHIYPCNYTYLISCGTMEGWSISQFWRTSGGSQVIVATLIFAPECQPTQPGLKCITHV